MKNWYALAASVVMAAFVVMCGGCGPDVRSAKEGTVTMKVGEYRTFTFAGRYTGDINWLTDDRNVATVNSEGSGGNGVEATVHAVGAGTTDLVAVDESFRGLSWHIVVK